MSDLLLDAVRRETLRLIQQQQGLLADLMRVPHLLKHENTNHHTRNFDLEEAEKWLRSLDNEATRVARLEMTLTVVGAMNAGKSTTINAIVGTEVLPTRSSAMTSLPTLIKHVPGRTVPQMVFQKPEPFNDALQALLQRLEAGEADGAICLAEFPLELRALAKQILSGDLIGIPSTCEGLDQVHTWLTVINDIARLCAHPEIDLPSPTEAFERIDEFPVVEIAFYHLADRAAGSTSGSFVLIDTPGPNESGQDRLAAIVDKQLADASAVLAVLDYGQLDSIAEEQIRAMVERSLNANRDRVFILVNKIEEYTAKAEEVSYEEVREAVAVQLDDLNIDHGQVFPASSGRAYLANRVLREVDASGSLPELRGGWVKEFGTLAYGLRWKERITDVEAVRADAEQLWAESWFMQPIAKVVRTCHDDAAHIALEAALAKMADQMRQVLTYVKLRYRGIGADVKVLEGQIDSLQDAIAEIRKVRPHADLTTQKWIAQWHQVIRDSFQSANTALTEAIDHLFQPSDNATELERRAPAASAAEHWWREPQHIYAHLALLLDDVVREWSHASSRVDEEGCLTFRGAEPTDAFFADLKTHIERTLDVVEEGLKDLAQKQIAEMERDLHEQIEAHVKPILDDAYQRLNEEFRLQLPLPRTSIPDIRIDYQRLREKTVATNAERVTVTVEREPEGPAGAGWRDRLERFFIRQPDTHLVQATTTDTLYRVDALAIRRDLIAQLGENQRLLEAQIDDHVTAQVRTSVDEHFRGLFAYINKFEGDLNDAREAKALELPAVQRLEEDLAALLPRITEHDRDVRAILDGMKDWAEAREEVAI